MKFRWYILLFKSRIKRIDAWLVMIAMLVLVLILSVLKLPHNDNYQVLVYSENEEAEERLLSILTGSQSVYNFEKAQSEEEIKDAVLCGDAECGFVLAPDYYERLLRGEQKHTVTYYCSSFTTKGEVAKETFFAALFEVESDAFLEASLGDLFEEPTEELKMALKECQEEYLNGSSLFRIDSVTVPRNGETNEYLDPADEKSGGTYPIEGVVAVLLFFSIYLAMGENLESEKKGYPLYLDSHGKAGFAFANMLSAATIPFVEAVILLIAFGKRSAVVNVGMLVAFVAYSCVWCFCLAKVLRKSERYQAAIIAVLLVSVSLSPIIWNAAELFPIVKVLRWLTPVGMFIGL